MGFSTKPKTQINNMVPLQGVEMIVKVKDIPTEEWVSRWHHINLSSFNNLEEMQTVFMDQLEIMCEDASKTNDWKHIIFSDYRETGTGQHPLGLAVDLFFYKNAFNDIDVLEMFIFALRFGWTGIGFYPYNEKTPAIHCDMRIGEEYEQRKALWWRDNKGNYHNGELLKSHLTTEWDMEV